MNRMYRFMILALIGFALGAGIAYVQAVREAPDAAVTEAVTTEDSAAELAMNAAAQDVTGSDAAAAANAHDHSAMEDHRAAAADAAAPVAGSTVGGAFTLTDHHGQTVTDTSWPEQYTLVFFGFTHCPDICPAALDKMTAALNALGDTAYNIQPLFITIDPARDDAATMKEYLADYHPSILGLTGTEEQIKQVENAYKVYAAKVDTGTPVYTMAHSSYVFLMSPGGELLEIFRDSDPADDLAARIRQRIEP